MISVAAVKSAIENHIMAGWITAPATPRTAVYYENAQRDQAVDTAWLEVMVTSGRAEKGALDGDPANADQIEGALTCSVGVPLNDGRANLDAHQDALHALLFGRRIELTGGAGTIEFSGPVEWALDTDGVFHILDWMIRFEVHDL
jgi:hypothetical protein